MRAGDDVQKVGGLAIQWDRAGPQPREVEDLVDHGHHAGGAGVDEVREARLLRVARGLGPLLEGLGAEPDGRERVPQVVRDVREELFLEALDLAQPIGHLIEGAAELADLVAPRDREGPGPGPGRERRGGRGQAAERSRHPVGEQRAGRQRQEQARGQRGAHRAPGAGLERAGARLARGQPRLGRGGGVGEGGLRALRRLARGALRDLQRGPALAERHEPALLLDVAAVRREGFAGPGVGGPLLGALQVRAELLQVAGHAGGAVAPHRGVVLILEHEGPGLQAHQPVHRLAQRALQAQRRHRAGGDLLVRGDEPLDGEQAPHHRAAEDEDDEGRDEEDLGGEAHRTTPRAWRTGARGPSSGRSASRTASPGSDPWCRGGSRRAPRDCRS